MLRKLLRSFLYLVFICVCVEVGLQGFYYFAAGDFLFSRGAVPIYAREPYAGFGNRPGLSFDHRTNEFRAQYYINRAGFRVPRPEVEYPLAKPSNVYRIMLLGPSFAFGWGVNYELSLAGVLQQLLQERRFAGDKKIEIIDAGVPAMPPAPQLSWFEHVGKDYAPDLVIQVVYESMVQDATGPLLAVNEDGYLVRPHYSPSRHESFKKVATVFYGWMLWTDLRSGSTVHSSGQGGEFEPTQPKVREAIQLYKKLASIVRQAGARLLVVYVPDSFRIHPEDESRWAPEIDPRQVTFDAAFVRYLNECHIPSVNTTQQLLESARGRNRMYYWLDVHWTPAGNAAAAQAVADYLTGRP